ncbi:hypothetical protein [Pseudoduganella namucuonensis]|uniref:Uncharacterized protein n=1 Tax=Pseudoduganella namucuonensis TaxID=1035707 RepID=A0A1I7JES7_9BURK|nr:hypothetical protein [Pseudoduganella namucuonensis]SFU83657.1 hypothetical protein SAMN05216552_101166 [Pseudoduganella namucuonensis]
MKITHELGHWQKKQIALLYHFSSLEFLENLQARINDLIEFTDATLDKANTQRRDDLLINKQWGYRNTSQNWGNHAWQLLVDFQKSISKNIARRGSDVYSITDANYCARGLAEYSMDWATPDEEAVFNKKFQEISDHAGQIDSTVQRNYPQHGWDDFRLHLAWCAYAKQIPQLPKLRLRPDINGMSGKAPPVTGVYVPQSDANGSPQFAWAGNPGGELLDCATFNGLGLAALREVGRSDLWASDDKMFNFVKANLNDAGLQSDSFLERSLKKASLAPSLVARHAFKYEPCEWVFVEVVPGEYESNEEDNAESNATVIRVPAGQLCPQSGFYFTPAHMNSRRHFNAGEAMPEVASEYGATIWQWDTVQG